MEYRSLGVMRTVANDRVPLRHYSDHALCLPLCCLENAARMQKAATNWHEFHQIVDCNSWNSWLLWQLASRCFCALEYTPRA